MKPYISETQFYGIWRQYEKGFGWWLMSYNGVDQKYDHRPTVQDVREFRDAIS